MTLPLSRNKTFANGDILDASDVNDFQDMVVGGLHGVKPYDLDITSFRSGGVPGVTQNLNGDITLGGAGSFAAFEIPLSGTWYISSLQVRVNSAGGGTDDVQTQLSYRRDAALTPISIQQFLALPAGWQTLTHTTGLPFTKLAVGDSLVLSVTSIQAAIPVTWIGIYAAII